MDSAAILRKRLDNSALPSFFSERNDALFKPVFDKILDQQAATTDEQIDIAATAAKRRSIVWSQSQGGRLHRLSLAVFLVCVAT